MAETIKLEIKFEIKFDDRGLVPVITQDANTREVLMLAYANSEALELTLKTKEAHYYSRSRKELWHKGATSGNIQRIFDVRYDCDSDAVLYLVNQNGVACHTGEYSCFYRSMLEAQGEKGLNIMNNTDALTSLQEVIADRRANPKEGSYTNYLFKEGIDKILKKIGEESAEVIIAAKNDYKTSPPQETISETSDLLYHLTVLLTTLDCTWHDIIKELKGRQ